MGKIAILTDSNSGITPKEAKKIGAFVVPMPVFINDELFFENETIAQEQFFTRLEAGDDIKTSMPNPGDLLDLWDKLLEEYEEIVYIPMSSGLSSSCGTAKSLAENYDGKVFVVDNQRISVTMRQSVLDALFLSKTGISALKIKEILEEEKFNSSIYITVDTLKYLKKGGRITPTAAAIGTVLNIKPVLQIQGEKLDAFKKARGKINAKAIMIEAMKNDFDNRFKRFKDDGQMCLEVAYSGNRDEADEWKKEVEKAFPKMDVYMAPLSLSVACHIGRGALAIACAKRIDK